MSIEVFFSYSEQDEQLRDELEKHLSILKRQGALAIWHHRQITAGTEWQGEIDAHLDSAQVILLLVSPDFFAADYIWDVEIQRAMERHASGLARVIPVLLRPVDNWQEAPFGKLQPLPTNGKPVTTWENRDRAFENIAAGIRKILESFSSEKTSLEIGEGVREKRQQWEKLVNLLFWFSDFFSGISTRTIWIISLGAMIVSSMLVTNLVMNIRGWGWLQSWELETLDRLMRWRPAEGADPNILIITVAREDIEYQDRKEMIRSGSLADEALAKLLQKLKPYNPAVIGLDILRDEPQDCQSAELAVKLRNELFGDRFIDICQIREKSKKLPELYPRCKIPTEIVIPQKNLGFADIVTDDDDVIRRQLLGMSPSKDAPQTDKSFSFQIAGRYLAARDKKIKFSLDSQKYHLQISTKRFDSRVFQRLTRHSGGYHQIDEGGFQVLLNYRSTKKIAEKVSLKEILEGAKDSELPNLVWGRIVLIGTIAPDYEDYHRTPFGEISGVEIQAHMISQLVSAVLQNRPILRWLPQQGEWIVVWMFSFLGSVPLWFFWLRRINFNLAVPIILSVSLSPGFCVGFAFFVLWWHGLWLPLVPSLIAWLISVLAWLSLVGGMMLVNWMGLQRTPPHLGDIER